jgi:hypothetical protein
MKKFFREVKRINWRETFFGSFKRTVITFILVIPLLVGASAFGYQYYLQLNPQVVYAHKLQAMTQQVSKSLSLPKDETPVVATVTDKGILPKQKFFSLAQNGDKILMYKKHKLAVLFRPTSGKVITQATLDFRDITPTPAGGSGTSAVAGASTSAAQPAATEVSQTPASGADQQSSGTIPYHPQGKILVQPQ